MTLVVATAHIALVKLTGSRWNTVAIEASTTVSIADATEINHAAAVLHTGTVEATIANAFANATCINRSRERNRAKQV